MKRTVSGNVCLRVVGTLMLVVLCLNNGFSQRHSPQKDSRVVIDTHEIEPALFGDDLSPKHDFVSPDGQYRVHLVRAKEGGYINLLILKSEDVLAHRKGKGATPKSVIPVQEDVTSFAWVPKRAHALVFATSDMYGWAGIRYWDGGTSLKVLAGRRGSPSWSYSAPLRMYELTGIDKEGRYVYYELWNDDGSKLFYRGRLRLPKR